MAPVLFIPKPLFQQAYDEALELAASKYFEGEFIVGQVDEFSRKSSAMSSAIQRSGWRY